MTYVVLGKTGNVAVDLENIKNNVGGFAIKGENASDFSGVSVSSGGDINGDLNVDGDGNDDVGDKDDDDEGNSSNGEGDHGCDDNDDDSMREVAFVFSSMLP